MSVDELSEQGVETQTIDKDLSCSRCGYNLKGLDQSGNCPECGQPIEETLTFGLHSADPAWLRYQSVTMLLLSAAAFSGGPGYGFVNEWFAYTLRLIGKVLGTYAVWRLSRPDPNNLSDRDGAIRRGLLAVVVIWLATFVYKPADEFSFGVVSTVIFIREGATLALWSLALLLIIRLASRTSYDFLKRHARICLWAYIVVQVIPYLAWAISSLIRPSQDQTVLSYVVTAVTWFASWVLLVKLLLLGRMFEVLRSTAVAATSPVSPH